MAIENYKNYFKNEFASRVFENVRRWEMRENGISSVTILALFLITSIACALLYLVINGTITDRVACSCIIASQLITAVSIFCFMRRWQQKYFLYSQENKFKSYYAQLGRKIEEFFAMQKTTKTPKFIKNPMNLPKDLFLKSLSFLQPSEQRTLSAVDRACYRESVQKNQKNWMQRIKEMSAFFWNELNEVRRKDAQNKKTNSFLWQQWYRRSPIANRYDMMKHGWNGESSRFGPNQIFLSDYDCNIMEMHSQFRLYHNQLMPQAIDRLLKA